MTNNINERSQEVDSAAPRALLDEILQKIGRNLLLNQKVEHALKTILGNARIEGTAEDISNRRAVLSTKSMGALQRMFRDEVLGPESDESVKDCADPTQVRFITTFRVELPESDRASLEAQLDTLTAARNELAHHFLAHWQPTSRMAMEQVSAQLDVQRENILAVHRRLVAMHEAMIAGFNAHAAFCQSEQGAAALERAFLQGSRMIELLSQIAATPRRADGWTDLSYAAGIAQRSEPDAFANRAARYGKRSIKALVIESGSFEVKEELLPRGTRTWIRNRPAPCPGSCTSHSAAASDP